MTTGLLRISDHYAPAKAIYDGLSGSSERAAR